MQMKHVKILLFIAVLVLIPALLFMGCSRDTGPDGPMPANAKPRCFLSNIPTAGEEYSKNPTLYWYATDEDGFIRKFRYIVKKADEIDDDPLAYAESVMASGNYDGWTVIYTDSLTPGKSATSDTIPFYAVADPEVYISQYFFVQAVDNEDEPSNFTDTSGGNITAVAFRMFSRNDHPPETHMNFDTAKVYFSLVDTTDTYKGIQISWSGSDSLDYKRTQPPFEYYWRVFGPFDSREEATNEDPSKFVYESYDSATADVWVSNEATVLFNLYRNEPAATTTRANYFLFEVRSRDDAFVPDPTPATTVFYAVEPGFEKGLMVVDNNTYVGQNCTYHSWNPLVSAEDTAVSMLQDYYKSLFQQAGYPPDYFFWYFWTTPNPNDYNPAIKELPALDTLLQYKYIVLLSENNRPINNKEDNIFAPLSDYMDLGGRVLFIGWNTFARAKGINRFGPSEFPYKYFGISAEYWTKWDEGDFSTFGPDIGVTPEEMIQAEAIVPDVPQTLTVDSDGNLMNYYVKDKWCPYLDTIWINDTTFRTRAIKFGSNYPYTEGAEPWVSYYVKTTAAEALYIARSIYSSKDLFGHDQREFQTKFKGMESIDGRVCGVRHKTEYFRTASFSFSLYCMPEPEAVEFLRNTLDWLTSDD
jgi:hypothetical protein